MTRKPQINGNKIIIPSDPVLIGEVDEFLETKLRERNISDTVIADIAICATEIVNNGIYHGNKQNDAKTVSLEISFNTEKVIIVVTDQGESFDPTKVQDPIAAENLLREVGRGIFIAKNLMDEVQIERAESGGTMVTLTKKIS